MWHILLLSIIKIYTDISEGVNTAWGGVGRAQGAVHSRQTERHENGSEMDRLPRNQRENNNKGSSKLSRNTGSEGKQGWDWRKRQNKGSEIAIVGHIKDVSFNSKCNEKAQDTFTASIWSSKTRRRKFTKVGFNEVRNRRMNICLVLKIFSGTYHIYV